MTKDELYESNYNYYYSIIKDKLDEFNKTEDNTKALEDIAQACRDLRSIMMDRIKGYYISINDIGPDDNFIRLYTRLGFITEEQAHQAVEELSDENGYGYDDTCRKVSEEEYKMFSDLVNSTAAYNKLYTVLGTSESRKSIEDARNALNKDIESLRKKLGLGFRWERVSEQVWYPSDDND